MCGKWYVYDMVLNFYLILKKIVFEIDGCFILSFDRILGSELKFLRCDFVKLKSIGFYSGSLFVGKMFWVVYFVFLWE